MENQKHVKSISGIKNRVGAKQQREKQFGVTIMLKLDIDWMSKRTSRFLISLPKPYEVRRGNKGINLRKDCSGCDIARVQGSCYDCWLYAIFDDQNRLKLNRQQEYRGLSHNIMWDIKKGKEKPDVWHLIETEQDADRFLRAFTGFY